MAKQEQLLWTNETIEFEENVSLVEEHLRTLGDILKEHISEDYIYIDAKNINWRGQSGYKKISNHKDSLELARNILPSYDCTFELKKDGDTIYAMVYSHDVPTGSYWLFKGLVDTEDIMGDISYSVTYDQGTIETFKELLKERLNIDISSWEQEDVTDDYQVQEGEKVYDISPNVDSYRVKFTVFVDEEGYIKDIDYCPEKLDRYYIHHVLS